MKNKDFAIKIVSILILLFFSSFVLFSNNVYEIANVCFYVYLGLVLIKLAAFKSVSFDILLLLGFIFIILAEMLFSPNSLEALRVSKYFVLGNNVILISYYLTLPRRVFVVNEYVINNRLWYVIVCLLLTAVFIIVVLPEAQLTVRYGRYYAATIMEGGLFATIVKDFGYILPALWAYCYREKRFGWLFSLLFSSPIFILLIMCGTRFPVLFSVLGFAITSGKIRVFNLKRRDLVYYLGGVIIVAALFSGMRNMRIAGFESDEYENVGNSSNIHSFSQFIASKGSAEGLLNANIWLQDYCQKNGFSYGKQSSFIFYWWIPRKLWHNKPTMTGGWLPHLYGNFSEGHSASVGIWGELYVDFGYFSFLFFVLYGFLIKRLESYCRYLLVERGNNVGIIKTAIIIPFVFFAVRSPITSFITLSISLALFYLMRFLLFKKSGLIPATI